MVMLLTAGVKLIIDTNPSQGKIDRSLIQSHGKVSESLQSFYTCCDYNILISVAFNKV